MAVFLRILIIFNLLASGGAFYFGWLLFNEREIMKHRTLRLERGLMDVSATIEEAGSELEENPLEEQDLPTIIVNQQLLHTYFRIDPATGKAWQHPTMKVRDAKAEGTTDHEINRVVNLALEAKGRLNDTREKLTETRLELEKTQDELAQTKEELANKIAELEAARAEIASLQQTIAERDQTIASQQTEIAELNDTINGQKIEIEALQEEIEIAKTEIDRQKDEIERLNGLLQTSGPIAHDTELTPGAKGSVEGVSEEWRYVVFNINNPEEAETMKKNDELHIKRGTTPVAKIKVTRVVQEENLAVGEIINIWRGQKIRRGDEVIY